MEVGLDQRDTQTGCVHDAQVGCATRSRSWVGPRSRPVGIDLVGAGFETLGRHQIGRRERGRLWVSDEFVSLPHHRSVRLDQRMGEGGISAVGRRIEKLEDTERGQREIPLRVGRNRPRHAAEDLQPERINPFRLVSRKVVGRDPAVGGLGHAWSNPAHVEVIAAADDRPQRLGQHRASQMLASSRRLASREHGGGRSLRHQLLAMLGPCASELGRCGKALGGETKRRRQHIGHIHGPVPFEEGVPAVDAAGNRDRRRPEEWHRRLAGISQRLGVGARTCSPRGVEAHRSVRSRRV